MRKSKVCDTKRAAQDWANQAEYESLNRDEVVGRNTVDQIAALRISEVTPADIADWRDRRLREVMGASVRREMQLMSSVFNIARKEWGWIGAGPACR